MDPSRDFAFVIMNATDQISGVQISDEGCSSVLGFEKSSGSSSLPLKILDKNGEDFSTEYKVVEYYFEVDGEKVVPVEEVKVREELARSDRQNGDSVCSRGEMDRSHLNGMHESMKTEDEKGLSTIGTIDMVKPDCSSEPSHDLPQMTFNVGSSPYTECSPVEKKRRMEVRVEDFRLLSAKKEGSCCCDKNQVEEEKSEMIQSEMYLSDSENEILPRITRSHAKNDNDAVPHRSGSLQRDDISEKKQSSILQRLSTGKLTVDATNQEHSQQGNSFQGINKETKPEIILKATTAKKKNGRKSQKLQSVISPEISEVQSRILESAVQPSTVQKRPVGRPRKIVAKSADNEAMVKDGEKSLQQIAVNEVEAKKLLKECEGGLKLQDQDALKTGEAVEPQNKQQESAVEMPCENVNGQTATANELSSKPQNNPSRKLHRGCPNSAAVDWDEESQSSYDVVLLRELSTDDSESKQVSDVDDPQDGAALNTKQATQKRISHLLAEIRRFTEQSFERFASFNISAIESIDRMGVLAEKEHLKSTVKVELDRVAALQKELNTRAQTMNSTEAELLTRQTRLKDLQQAYDIEDARNALRQEELDNARLMVAEERRRIAADQKKLRSGKYRGYTASPSKPLNTGKNLIKRTSTARFCRKRRSEEAELQSSTKPQEASFVYSSTTPEIVARMTTEVHVASATCQPSSVASVPETTASAASSPKDESLITATTADDSPSSPLSVSSLETVKDPLGSCLPLEADCPTALSSESPSYHVSTYVPSPKSDIPLSLSFPPDAETAFSDPPASFNIPSSSLSSSNVDTSTALSSYVETRPPLSSLGPCDEIDLPSSASEVEICLPSSSLEETEIILPSSPFRTDIVQPATPASVCETTQPASSSSMVEILPSVSSSTEIVPPTSSLSLAETPTSVSSSSAVEILPTSVTETLLSDSLPLKTKTLSSTSATLPSNIECRSPTKTLNSSPSTPLSSKSTRCQSSTISCDSVSPTCRHLFFQSVCMLPSVTLVPVTAPYVLQSHVNHPSMSTPEKSSSTRLSRKRVSANGSNRKAKKTAKL